MIFFLIWRKGINFLKIFFMFRVLKPYWVIINDYGEF
ncbi:hypothetical protein ABIE26_000300 [Pedobacter africanus]|uniref:Uncharacterized protein n=1 Tax=Pedobacter africanus TaxID=151894 RepID=A0ACC6KVK9_9SPHI|nr:hypothetical protein [Pedobacter africanus]